MEEEKDQGEIEDKEENKEKETESEIVPETEGEEGVSSLNPAERVKKLKEKLLTCQKERQEYLAQAQRFKADYINLKRQGTQEQLEIIKFAKEDLLRDLVDLADNFELAFQNRAIWEAAPESWRKGVEYIYSKLTNIFRQHNLEEIYSLGEKFDPTRHHSIMTIDTEKDEEDNVVLEVVQKGYLLNGKVIRPAQVKIGHKK